MDGGQNCYKLFGKQPKNWLGAQDFCKSEGGNLVSIRDGFEQAYVSLIKTGSVNSEWIGLRSYDLSVFSWIDTWDFSYTNWAVGFNSSIGQYNKCGYLVNFESVWNTGTCDTLNDFICKISKGKKLNSKLLINLEEAFYHRFIDTSSA